MTTAARTLGGTHTPVANRAPAYWLLVCCAMVFVMVVLGGVTRLTLSGLSITEWNPIMGAIPPLNDADWQAQFALYKQSPQYLIMNPGMGLPEFKSIFWWEFIHRLWGRTIGLVFLVPFLYFLWRGWLHRQLVPKLVILFLLGGLQGALGWFMVKSGLVGDNTSVSQYRLAAHLAAAFVIYAYMLSLALDLLAATRAEPRRAMRRRDYRRGTSLSAWVFFVAISGAFVAGLHAGLIYNTFPLMDGQLVPDGLFSRAPFVSNFFADVTTVQFDHRVLAITTLVLVVLFRISLGTGRLPPRAATAANLLFLMVLIQVALGISTLIFVVPVPLAAAHQAGALMLFTLALWTAHELKPERR